MLCLLSSLTAVFQGLSLLAAFFLRVLYVQTCQTLQTGMERSVFALPPLHAHLLVSDLTMWNLEQV